MTDTPALEIAYSDVGSLELEGSTATYVNLEESDAIPSRLLVSGIEYAYDKSFPVHGHSAVLPDAIAEHAESGKRVVIAERTERYIVYVE